MTKKKKSNGKKIIPENVVSNEDQPKEPSSFPSDFAKHEIKSDSYFVDRTLNDKVGTTALPSATQQPKAYSHTSTIETQSKTTMLFASFFLGAIGLHRLLMGYKNWWLMLLTLGGFGTWSIFDFVRIALGKMHMANGEPLRK